MTLDWNDPVWVCASVVWFEVCDGGGGVFYDIRQR